MCNPPILQAPPAMRRFDGANCPGAANSPFRRDLDRDAGALVPRLVMRLTHNWRRLSGLSCGCARPQYFVTRSCPLILAHPLVDSPGAIACSRSAKARSRGRGSCSARISATTGFTRCSHRVRAGCGRRMRSHHSSNALNFVRRLPLADRAAPEWPSSTTDDLARLAPSRCSSPPAVSPLYQFWLTPMEFQTRLAEIGSHNPRNHRVQPRLHPEYLDRNLRRHLHRFRRAWSDFAAERERPMPCRSAW